MQPNVSDYDTDFYRWTQETAQAILDKRTDAIDWEHVAEEIRDLGKSQKRELESRLRVIASHLLKCRYQPNQRSRSWDATIRTQQLELRTLLKQNPSLERAVPDALNEAFPGAAQVASLETGLPLATFPQQCPFTPDEVLGQ